MVLLTTPLAYQGRGNHHFFLGASIRLVTIAAFAQALITLGLPVTALIVGTWQLAVAFRLTDGLRVYVSS
jgi:hypothetical protein